ARAGCLVERRSLVAGEPLEQQFLPFRPPGHGLRVDAIRAVLDAPAVKFAASVVTPIPLVRFKKLDQVPDVAVRALARRPADGAELADVDVHVVKGLEFDDRLQRRPELFLIPRALPDRPRVLVRNGPLSRNPLM